MRINALEIWTDGACSRGVGGWGAVLHNPVTGQSVDLSDGPFHDTTNNQMEMMAIIYPLEFLLKRKGPQRAVIYSDSQYAVKGLTEWMPKWASGGWITSKGTSVKNAELWKRMQECRSRHHFIALKWVKGHAGNVLNERADRLAVAARENTV